MDIKFRKNVRLKESNVISSSVEKSVSFLLDFTYDDVSSALTNLGIFVKVFCQCYFLLLSSKDVLCILI